MHGFSLKQRRRTIYGMLNTTLTDHSFAHGQGNYSNLENALLAKICKFYHACQNLQVPRYEILLEVIRSGRSYIKVAFRTKVKK